MEIDVIPWNLWIIVFSTLFTQTVIVFPRDSNSFTTSYTFFTKVFWNIIKFKKISSFIGVSFSTKEPLIHLKFVILLIGHMGIIIKTFNNKRYV